MITPEGRVKAALKKYLDEIGAYHFWPVQTGYGKRTLDVLVCYNGYFLGVECKRPGVIKSTKFQEMITTEIRGKGGLVWLENSETLETTKRMIRGCGN